MDLVPCRECGGLEVSVADDLTDASQVHCARCGAMLSGRKPFRGFCIQIVACEGGEADGRSLGPSSAAQDVHPAT